MGKLTVFLDRVENLKDEDKLGKSDPYLKFEVEQEKFGPDKSYGKFKSSIKKDDLNPVYGETFTFNGLPGLDKMVLLVEVRDDDIGHDEKLGDCKFKLSEMGITDTPQEFSKVVDHKGLGLIRKHAKVYLKISYTPEAM